MIEEVYLQDQLERLFSDYQKAAKPILDRLVAIQSMKMPLPMKITYDQWKTLQDDEVMK